jgi:tetratricopeptide (TPR) repeat protein
MNRIASISVALGMVMLATSPAWAHHSYYYGHEHHSHYYSSYYYGVPAAPGNYYNSTCTYYINQGDAFENQGDHDHAITAYTQAIANDPNCKLAYAQRGGAWYEKGEFDKAIADDTQAIAIDRNFAAAYNNRSAVWDAKNEFDKALADANQALALRPSYVEAYVSRGAIWFNKGEFDKAIADDNQALAIDPSSAQAYDNRASAWNMKGDYEKAKSDFNQALAIESNNASFYNDLAFFQATCLDGRFRDAKAAFANASKAYQLNNGVNLDGNFSVLASTYAENGDFAKAIEWQGKAIDQTSSSEMKQRYLARLELFKQNKPFRLDPKTAMQVPTTVANTAN